MHKIPAFDMVTVKRYLFQKHLWCKKGEAKLLNNLKVWGGQEEKIYPRLCRTPAYKACKLSKYAYFLKYITSIIIDAS